MGKWILKTDQNGHQVLINPKAAWILDYSFNLDEHLAELYNENTKAKLLIMKYLVHYLKNNLWHYERCSRIKGKYYNAEHKKIDNKNIFKENVF